MYVSRPILVALLGMISFLPACGKLQAVVDVAEPKVSVGLGMTASDVARDSASRVIFHEVMPNGMRSEYHEDFTHELRYVHPVRGFSISGMESIAMIIRNSVVNHIDDRPSSRMMSLDAGLAWCERTAAIIDKAGWTRDKDRTTVLYSGETQRSYPSMQAVRAAFVDTTLESPLQRVKMVSWKNEKRIISIELERKRYGDAPSGALSDEIAYMVTLSIYDDFLTPVLEATTPRP